MSASRLLPTWRPIHDCGERLGDGAVCPQPNAFDDPKGRCYYHAKLLGLGMLNGADSRRGPGNHSGRARPRYDYATWFDGQQHTLTWNVDYFSDAKQMRSIIVRASHKHGVDLDVFRVDGGPHGTITVRARRAASEGAA